MSSFLKDLRQAGRAMRRNPGFAAIAVLTIALGIGANTAIFSVVHAVLLKPIPYPAENPADVLVLREKDKKYPDGFGVAYLNFKDWREQSESFTEVACFRPTGYTLTGLGEPVPVSAVQVTANYFGIMGIRPVVGRLLTAEEGRPGAAKVALLNHTLWTNRFGADPEVTGRTLRLDGEAYTIIGVLPPEIDLRSRERVYVAYEPWAAENNEHRGDHMDARVLARLKPGVSLAQAEAEMDAIARRLEQEYPQTNSGNRVKVERLNESRTREYRLTLWLLLGAVGFVLLIACANVANLLLARAVSRQKEMAVLASLGASRWRLARQTLTESLLLSTLGGLLGVAVGVGALHLLRGILPEDLPRLHQIGLNLPVLGYTFLIAGVTGLLFGLAPAFQNARINLGEALKQAGATSGALQGRRRLARGLLIAETAVATVLLIGAGLLVRTLYELTRVDPGFRTGWLLKVELELAGNPEREERRQFFGEVKRRLEALPGVEAVAVSLSAPMMGSSWSSIFIVGDKPVPPREDLPSSIFNPVGPDYFETFGIPLKKGRYLSEADTANTRPVIVINETLAERIWPGEDPIGKRLKQGWPETEDEFHPWCEVVGVVGDTKQYGLDAETRMQSYFPFAQRPLSYAKVTLRTGVEPRSLIDPVKKAVHEVNADVPVASVETMDEIFADSLASRRVTMTLLLIFAGLAMLLAAIGTYGVIAYSVARRTQEMGVRMAVGAGGRDVLRLVVGQGMRLALAGAVIGVVGAVWLARLLEHLLYGVRPFDPPTFAIVPALLSVVALLACTVPGIRAMRIHPSAALRYE